MTLGECERLRDALAKRADQPGRGHERSIDAGFLPARRVGDVGHPAPSPRRRARSANNMSEPEPPDKAQDSTAKAQVRSAETAAETYASDHNGEYKGLEPAKLKEVEPTLGDEGSAKLIKAEAKGGGFLVESEAVTTKNKYAIERNGGGGISRKCEKENAGGCPSGGSW